LWDEEDGFYYDRLRHPDGSIVPVRARSIVGVLPLLAVGVIDEQGVEEARRLDKHSAALLEERTHDLRERLISLFLVGPDGGRPCFGWAERFQHDPNWKDNVLFNEYFHGDNGAGLGASHQTGWTGIVADLIIRGH